MSDNFKHMQSNELQQRLGSHQANPADSPLVIVDIRDANSFNQGHIHGAIHLSNESLAEFIRSTDPDATTVVCCYHGHSSQQAAQYLVSQDFTDVYSLDGGFTQWQSLYPAAVIS
jgi:thiosulfate sulfurtransferase